MTHVQFIVNIDVDDLDRAVEFYVRAFGLTCRKRLFEGSVAEMIGGPAPIHLLEKPAASVAVPHTDVRRAYGRHWTPVHLDFVVDDITSAVERAVGAGATLDEAIAAFEWGCLALMRDPFGHGFCFVQFARADYDAS